MFNQRSDPYFQKIRQLVHGGELGAVRRIQWTITNWFRTDAYYEMGDWRATWRGEGGGVLLNQCPHNLDLFQWIFGMPRRVTGFCTFGRYHDIEVEDDVTAYFEYAGGTHATFITSTGEAPGTNRLEIAADNGRLVYEDDRIVWLRNDVPMGAFSRTSSEAFGRPNLEEIPVPADGHGGQHVDILQNFTDSILDGVPLIAPAAEGIHSVELANAILLSAWTGARVELPLNAAAYEAELRKRMASSRPKTAPARRVVADLSKSVA
jgi:predicted dehydrogenase